MPKQSAEFITGTTESDVDGRMINMNSELVASSLSRTLGGGFRSALSPHWDFSPKRGDGIVPLNHILKFNTFGDLTSNPEGTKCRAE